MKKIIVFSISILIAMLIFGCTYTPNAPPKEGTNCDGNAECMAGLAQTCEKGYSHITVPEEQTEIFVQFLGMENDLCKTYVQAIKNPNLPDALKGLDMTCWFPLEKIQAQDYSTQGVKCEGPLYEGLKASGITQ